MRSISPHKTKKTKKTKKTRRKAKGGATEHKTALCIPCTAGDVPRIGYCFESVKAQTQPPDEIVVSLSSAKPEHTQQVHDAAAKYGIKITLLSTNKPAFASKNRNMAAKEAMNNGATLLHFFDADDIMHPQYIELLTPLISKHSLTGLLHAYKHAKKLEPLNLVWPPLKHRMYINPFGLQPKIASNKQEVKLLKTEFGVLQKNDSHDRTCGHITVLADFWKTHPYMEDIGPGEDSIFAAQIIAEGLNLGYTPDVFSYYMR